GVLVLRVAPADAPTIEYAVPHLRDRINAHYGYQAVSRIKLLQRAPPARPRPGPAPAPTPDVGKSDLGPALRASLAGIEDAELRTSLAALGQAIQDRERKSGR
ncbi:MAG: DUF721 domain-containing protein, partial [Alphaproteobacteria bacterium]|nr:DUF721 domain-containing protein [Alphaproteobacteria bacterium]